MNIKRITSAIALAFGLAMAVPALASAATTVTAENFNTHSGTDYKGISVGFNVSGTGPLTEVKVELLDDGKVLVTNVGTPELFALYPTTQTQFSSPFVTFHGTYDTSEDEFWQFGEWTKLAKPDTARITVNGQVVTNTNLVEPDGWTFETLLPLVNGENFNTHKDANYEGINVGFNVAGFDELESVTVKLLDASGKVLVTNTGTEELFELYEEGTRIFSTPFYTKIGLYGPTDPYWNFGNWSSYAEPVKAVITVNGIEETITPLTENGITWASIVPPAPINKEACKNGGWEGYYKNQGQCVSSFASKNKNVTTNTNTVTITNNNSQTSTTGSANSRGGGNANSGNANNSIVTTIRLAFSQLF